MIPRPYQVEATRRLFSYAAANPTGRVLMVIPARGGKTLVGSLAVRDMALRHGLPALWIAHREELLGEAVAHLVKVGVSRATIGVIKSGYSSDPTAKIQVASDATLARRDRPAAALVVSDEAHRDTAPRRRRLRQAYPHAFLLGLTATPKAPPQRNLTEDYDALMVVVQPSELIHDGFLAAPTVYAPDPHKTPDLRGLRLVGGDYSAEDLEPLLVRGAVLDDHVREWARLSEGRTTIAFPVTIEHSKALVARFQAAGVRALHLDGNTPDRERRKMIAELGSGALPVISSVSVLSEGTNVPRVKCVLGVRPTRSLTLDIQQKMRCATPWRDVQPRILDVVGNVYRHGFPFDDRNWSLVSAESGTPVKSSGGLRRCAKCGAISPGTAQACSACAGAFPATEIVMPSEEIELHPVSPTDALRDEELERLVAYARQRGFAKPDAWAERVMQAKHGVAA